jgi:hypothetical protein
MEPDPDVAFPSLVFILWLCVFLFGVVVTIMRFAI